jgi:hypothetical protein
MIRAIIIFFIVIVDFVVTMNRIEIAIVIIYGRKVIVIHIKKCLAPPTMGTPTKGNVNKSWN